jgi:thiamine-phosphate pyrophosphorylase
MQQRQRQTGLPQMWLMSDARLGTAFLRIVKGLPAGSGIILRDYDRPLEDRIAMAQQVSRIARRRGLIWLWSGDMTIAHIMGADGVHGGRGHRLPHRAKQKGLIRSAPAHNLRELRHAERAGADMLLLSPIFPTRSHAAVKSLGPMRAAALGRATHLPVMALGGMNVRRFRRLSKLGFSGWAGIDAFGF